LRRSVPILLSAAIAVVAVAGLVFVALGSGSGAAPGNGQQVFDAPGCLTKSYAGPARVGHYMLNRNCPRPAVVILHTISRSRDGWRVTWDGSRSFNRMGGRLVEFEWSLHDGQEHRRGRRIVVHYRRPGAHSVILYVTNDSGLYGTRRQTVRLP
jgi:PKD domain